MFRRKIEQTALSSGAANEYFSNIYGDNFQGDVSFTSTLRALVFPRMAEDESIYLCIRNHDYTGVDLKKSDDEYTVGLMLARSAAIVEGNHGVLQVINCNSYNADTNELALNAVERKFETMYPKFKKVNKISGYYKEFAVKCYVDEENKNIVLFTESMDLRRYHFLQCAVPAMFPWYFVGKEITQEEVNLIYALRSNEPEDYIQAIAGIASHYDLRELRIKQLLEGFEHIAEKQEANRLRESINHCEGDMKVYAERFQSTLLLRKQKERELFALELAIENDNGESEIMDYFLQNRRLVLETVDNYEMIFGARDYLEYFDSDMAEQVIGNKRSYVYKPEHNDYGNIIPSDDIELLMRAIFIDRRLKIRVCAAYKFVLGSGVNGMSHFTYSAEYSGYTPNPHIDQYSCMGDYQRSVGELVSEGNYILALEQCVASAKSLNFGDSVVMTEFMKRIYGMSSSSRNVMQCIELPDGSIVNPKEAIEWLKEQNPQEETQEVEEDGEEN